MPAPFGTDRVEPEPDAGLLLSCRQSKGWRPRIPASGKGAAHPGTAVSWEGAIYEVVDVRVLPDGGVRYALAPWTEGVAIRSIERYDEDSEGARDRERRRRRDAVHRRHAAILLAPLLGHLPGPVQERMESEFGAPANAMTWASTLPLLLLGMVGLIAAVARVAGGTIAPLPEPPPAVSLYLVAESSARLAIVVSQGRPAGSLPGALVYEIWKRLAPLESGRRSP